MTGRQFEDYCVKKLHEAGYWVHRIHPDESGQQPFDIIAVRGNKICAYDAKVVSDGKRFTLQRIEDNQLNAFRLLEKKSNGADIGLLIWDGVSNIETIRFVDIGRINTFLWLGKKSIALDDLPEWRL